MPALSGGAATEPLCRRRPVVAPLPARRPTSMPEIAVPLFTCKRQAVWMAAAAPGGGKTAGADVTAPCMATVCEIATWSLGHSLRLPYVFLCPGSLTLHPLSVGHQHLPSSTQHRSCHIDFSRKPLPRPSPRPLPSSALVLSASHAPAAVPGLAASSAPHDLQPHQGPSRLQDGRSPAQGLLLDV